MPGILGIVPARAGSVGVPGKNIRPLAGRPLIVHTVEAARRSRLDRLVVSTDSEEIAAIAVAAGAERPFLRPAELATGSATAYSVVRHALEHFRRHEGWTPQAVLYLQPTSPFRAGPDIDAALDLLAAHRAADTVVSVAPALEHPSFAWFEREGGLVPALPIAARPERRQDLVPAFMENNAIMLSRTSYLLGPGAPDRLIVNLENFVPIHIDWPVALDINTEMDFRFAEFLMSERCGATA
jgi:CMP-N,N'-diacetyllegionaminic acid synthase